VAHFFGMFGCRVFSAIQTALVAYLAYRIARRVAPEAGWAVALAPLCVWVQPLPMTLAYTTLTETTAALYLALAVWLFMRGSHVLGGLSAGMLFVTRYEALVLAPLFAAPVVRGALRQAGGKLREAVKSRRAWASAGLMLAPAAIYLAVVFLAGLPPDASPIQFARNVVEEYGRGPWDHHVMGLLVSSGLGMVAAATAGAALCPGRAWLPALVAAGFVGLHTLIFHYGVVASGGYPRFLVPVCGPVGALAAVGLAIAWDGRKRLPVALAAGSLALWALVLWRGRIDIPLTYAGTAIAVAGAVVGAAGLIAWHARARAFMGRLACATLLVASGWQAAATVRPLTHENDPHRFVVARAAEAMAKSPYAGRPALTGHVLAGYLWPGCDVTFSREAAMERWRSAAPGTLYFWENKYGCEPVRNGTSPAQPGLLYQELLRRGKLLGRESHGEATAEVFERLPDGPACPGPAGGP
jgi:hypothetical protein